MLKDVIRLEKEEALSFEWKDSHYLYILRPFIFPSLFPSLQPCLHVIADLANHMSLKGDSAHCANCPQHIYQQHIYQQSHQGWLTDKSVFLEPAGTNSSLISDPCVTKDLFLP